MDAALSQLRALLVNMQTTRCAVPIPGHDGSFYWINVHGDDGIGFCIPGRPATAADVQRATAWCTGKTGQTLNAMTTIALHSPSGVEFLQIIANKALKLSDGTAYEEVDGEAEEAADETLAA